MNRRLVWAPSAQSVELVAAGKRLAMQQNANGWWSVEMDDNLARADYAFSVDHADPVPDPCSPSQPEGVLGFSHPIDHSSFPWSDDGWRQPLLGSAIIYECHVGTFTAAGTFDAAIDRLQYLKNLGISHVELMPVAEFSGDRGWGYDGVNLYAPHHA